MAQLRVAHCADFTPKDGRLFSLPGTRGIDETKFNALPDAGFCRRPWRTRGRLPWLHAHFVSVEAWSDLMDRMVVAVR